MVQHEKLVWKGIYESDRDRKMAGSDQDVVDESAGGQQGDAALEIFEQKEVVVPFILDQMPHSAKPGMAAEFLKLFLDESAAQVDPADHPGDEGMVVGQLQQPAGFGEMLPCLNRDAGVDSGLLHQRLQVGGQKIPPQRFHPGTDPGIFRRQIAPEVLVTVHASQIGTSIRSLTPATGDEKTRRIRNPAEWATLPVESGRPTGLPAGADGGPNAPIQPSSGRLRVESLSDLALRLFPSSLFINGE